MSASRTLLRKTKADRDRRGKPEAPNTRGMHRRFVRKDGEHEVFLHFTKGYRRELETRA